MTGGFMKYVPGSMMLLALAATLLAGCGSAEDRINQAVPVSPEVETAKAALDKAVLAASPDAKEALEAEYRSQLKVRALECSAGYTPSAFAGAETIREEVGNAECFAAADAKLGQWIGMRHAGLLATMPPLRPVPAQPPAMLVATDRIQRVTVAEAAGVVVLESGSHYQLVDAGSGATIRVGPRFTGMPTLSPNGRVLVSSAGNEMQLQDVETGELLATVSGMRAVRVYWLHDRGLVYVKPNDKVAFFDWASGNEAIVPMEAYSLAAAIPVPGQPDTFMLLGGDRAVTLKLACTDKGCTPQLLQETKIAGSSIWLASAGAAGDHAVFGTGSTLNRIHLASLQNQAVSFEPMRLNDLVATRNPDQFIVKASVDYGRPNLFLYSVANRTLAKIDTDRLLSARLSYAPVLGGNVAIDGSKLIKVDAFPTEPPVSLASMVNSMQFDAQVAKLERMDRMASLRAAVAERPADELIERSLQAARLAEEAARPSRSFPPGEAGLTEALRAGVLRLGNSGDVNAWKVSYHGKTGRSPSREFDDRLNSAKVYVITGDMVIPSGLTGAYGVVFVLNSGVPYPRGNPGHSMILDVKSGSCGGPLCSMMLR